MGSIPVEGTRVIFTELLIWAIFSVVDQEAEIEELRELIEKNIALSEETNKMMRQMRRSARLGRLFQMVWWLLVVGVSAVSYYYYVQPYVAQIERIYTSGQQQSQNLQQQVGSFLKYITPGSTTTK